MKSLKPLEVSRAHIVAAVANYLQAISAIPDEKAVIDIKFGDLTQDIVTLEVIYKQEVKVTIYNNGHEEKEA